MVVISDEDDSSEAAPESYIDALKRLRPVQDGEHARVLVSAVVSAGADRYLRVVDEFGGVRLDINASDWGAALGDIGNATFDVDRRFTLANAPEPGSAVVEVNGTPTTAFSVNSSQVLLNEAPPAGSTVVITYAPRCGAP